MKTHDKSQPARSDPSDPSATPQVEAPPTDMIALDAIEVGYNEKKGQVILVGLAGGQPYIWIEGQEDWLKLPYLKANAKAADPTNLP